MGARGSRRDPPAVRDGGGMSAPPRGRYHPLGIRLDSGDLATLSKQARAAFSAALERYGHIGVADVLTIVASNDISEESLVKLNAQGHSIDTFGIGTHLVTCQAQPALGCVYKLVECGGTPRIKLSQELAKAPPARRLPPLPRHCRPRSGGGAAGMLLSGALASREGPLAGLAGAGYETGGVA